MKRPLAVTLIAWFTIVSSVLGALNMLQARSNPMVQELMRQSALSIGVQTTLAFIGFAVSLIAAVAMLRRRDWGRWLLVGYSVLGLLIGLVTSPFKGLILFSGVLIAVYAFFLFRDPADRWFKGASA